jgi:1-acyl-sn-glycerol-3-phosphate acyltransferase
MRAVCRLALRRIEMRVEGLHYVPATGPIVIAARHFHHLYDGCALIAIVPHQLHVVVALDWLEHPARHRLMAYACRFAGWPVVSRPDQPRRSGEPPAGVRLAVDAPRLRPAVTECVRLLQAGQSLLVFPEGYPNVDPGYTPKTDDDAFLPFRPGFLRFVAMAERDGRTRVPIVPVGLAYSRGNRWRLTGRFGPPIVLAPGVPAAAQVLAIEEQVRWLSGNDETGGGTGA